MKSHISNPLMLERVLQFMLDAGLFVVWFDIINSCRKTFNKHSEIFLL